MSPEASLIFQWLFTAAFAATLLSGCYLVKNDRKLFGHDHEVPADHESGRFYNKMQVYAIWAHLLFLTGAFALYLR